MPEKNVYEIMHMDRRVAKINDSGQCKIYYKSFMPYNLYLEEAEDIETLVQIGMYGEIIWLFPLGWHIKSCFVLGIFVTINF